MIRSPLWILLLSLVLPVVAAGDVPVPSPAPRVELLAASRMFPWFAEHLTVADLDGDGDMDLVHLADGSVSSSYDPQGYWIENLGGREFAPLRMMALRNEHYLERPAVMNLTGDAKPEIFASGISDAGFAPLALTPHLGRAGPLSPAGMEVLAGPERYLGAWAAVDLDADGQGELIFFQEDDWVLDPQATLRIYDRQADGRFAESAVVKMEYHGFPSGFEAIDLDGDGDRELSVNLDSGRQVLERTGPRGFAATPVLVDSIQGGKPWGDLDGDGLPDAVGTSSGWVKNHGGLDFEWKQGPGAFGLLIYSLLVEFEPRAGLPALAHGVVQGAGVGYDWVKMPYDSVEPVSRQRLPVSWGDHPAFLKMADLDGDGQQDLVYRYETPPYAEKPGHVLAVVWGAAAGQAVESQVLHAGPASGHRILTGDFNRDKAVDLIAGPDALGHYHMRLNAGRTPESAPAGTGEWLSLAGLEMPGVTLEIIGAARMDRGKALDLVCKYTQPQGLLLDPVHAIVVVRGRKDGSFYKPEPPAEGMFSSLDFPAAGSQLVDWDRDGDLDLVGGGFWLKNDKGSFPPAPSFLVGLGQMKDPRGKSTPVGKTVTGDLDGDRRPDIISLVYGEGAVEPGPGLSNGLPKKMLIAFNDGRGGIGETVELPFQLAQRDYFTGEPVIGEVVVTDLNRDRLPDLWIREFKGIDPMADPVAVDRWLQNPGRGSRNVAEWVSQPLEGPVVPGLSLADFDGDRKLEWVSATGFLKPTKQGPLVSEPYDFTGDTSLGVRDFRAGVDYDADGDVDFVIGGGGSPLLVLYNPSADGLKKRRVKVKAVKWAEAVR